MGFKTLGSGGDSGEERHSFFAGYCKYCKRKHFLTRNEAQLFIINSHHSYLVRKANPLLLVKMLLVPKLQLPKIRIIIDRPQPAPEPVALAVPAVKKKTVNPYFFDQHYKHDGGVEWLQDHASSKLKDIAGHYGFSIEYARRAKASLT